MRGRLLRAAPSAPGREHLLHLNRVQERGIRVTKSVDDETMKTTHVSLHLPLALLPAPPLSQRDYPARSVVTYGYSDLSANGGSDLRQGLFQVGNQVLGVFDTHRQSDQTLCHPDLPFVCV